ncbi:DUF4083 family protein [Mesobacillus selenatarsenatis]|uniref:DUF4083 family protein n=1 Tax=Mesobacillus selenatarsenatis TaxID=388741 RepID=UPI000A064F8D
MISAYFFHFINWYCGCCFYAVRSLVIKVPDNSKSVERKLDRIIELLEKENKD